MGGDVFLLFCFFNQSRTMDKDMEKNFGRPICRRLFTFKQINNRGTLVSTAFMILPSSLSPSLSRKKKRIRSKESSYVFHQVSNAECQVVTGKVKVAATPI